MTRSDREIWSQKLLRFYRVCKSVDPKCFLWKTKTKFLTHSFAKISAFCDAHPLYLFYKLFTGSAVCIATCLIRVTARIDMRSRLIGVRSLVPPAALMRVAGAPQAICLKLPLE